MDQLLKTKLHAPQQRPSLVERPRLLARLNAGWRSERPTSPAKSFARKLTLICAPAGYGKTTLAMQWLHGLVGIGGSRTARSSLPAAWLTLDEADSDPRRFIPYLIAALQEAGLSPGADLAALLRAPQMPPPETTAAAICNTLDNFAPMLLVLEDYHRVQGQYIHDVIAQVLAHLPPGAHLVLLTREEPPFSLARLRGSGDMVEIRQGDIAFTEQEATVYLTVTLGLNLSSEEIAVLERRTEGWIAGLQLAALALREQPSSPEGISSHEFIDDFAGSNKFILDYLLDEVFRRQPEQVRVFLLQTAILDQMCASLCTAVSGYANSQSMLHGLEQDNLFVIPLDNERKWYRYHHLFADLLRYRLFQEELPVEVLHGRAAVWLAENGFTAAAIKHALAASDWEYAAALIVANSEACLRQGQIATLLGWIEALPPQTAAARPDLALAAAWALVLSGSLDEAEAIVQPLASQMEANPALKGEIVTLQMHIARARHDAPRTIALSQQALDLLPPEDAARPEGANARSVIYASLGAAYVYEGDLARAAEVWAAAAEDGRRANNYYAAALALTFLGQLRAAFGWLHESADLHRQAIQLGDVERSSGPNGSSGALPVAARAHVNLAALLYEWNDLAAADIHLQQALKLCELVGDLHARRDALRVLALVQQAQGDTASALETIRAAEEMVHKHQAPENARLAVALTHLQLALAIGDLTMAMRWQNRIDHLLPRDVSIRTDLLTNAACYTPFPALLQARLQLARGDREAAAKLLSGCYESALAAGFGYSLVTIRLLQALAATDGGTAVEYMAEALQRAQPEEYIRTFLIWPKFRPEIPGVGAALPAAMAGILRETSRRYPALAPYARRLLVLVVETDASEREQVAQQPTAVSQEMLGDPLSERQLEVLRLLDQHKTNAEIAQALVLSSNTVKTHLRHIYEKLGVHDRRKAVARARDLGLI